MYLVVLFLVHGALFVMHYPQSVTGIYFTSSPARVVQGDTGSGKLTLKCSVNEADVKRVYTIKIKRETSQGSNVFQLFAYFEENTATNLDEAELDDQITNNREFIVSGDKSGSPPYLQVTMSIQTMDCTDARLYSCDYVYESDSDLYFTVYQNATLEVFVLPSMTSLQARKNGQFIDGGSLSNKAVFDSGDMLQLTCEAAIGSIKLTRIRWERSSETGSGYIAASGIAYTINDGTALNDNQCGYTRTSTLAYNVTNYDSSYPLSFRCFVTVSGYPSSSSTLGGSYTTPSMLLYHLDVIVECPQDTFGEQCSGKCYCAEGTCTHNYGICPGKCRSGYRGPHCNEAVSMSLIIGGTAGATAALLVITALIGFVVYRACRKNRSSGTNVYTTPDLYVTPAETPAYDTLDNVNDIRGSENNIYENEKVSEF